MNALSIATGLSRMQLYRIAKGDQIGPRARERLSEAMTCNVIFGA